MATTKVTTGLLDGQKVVQVVETSTGAVATGTTVVPNDDTVPQNTEGVEFMTLAITPTNASNLLKIDVTLVVSNSAGTGNAQITSIFQDTTAGALLSISENIQGSTILTQTFAHYMAAATTSSTTFKVRSGNDTSGTTTFNGAGGARKYGGVSGSSIRITEYSA